MAEQTSEQAAQARAQEALKADQARQEAAKKRLADEKTAREKMAQEAPDAGKPTPTQEENDLAALGVHLPEHEADGSPPQDPFAQQLDKAAQDKAKQKQVEGQRSGQYQTRQSQAQAKPADTA